MRTQRWTRNGRSSRRCQRGCWIVKSKKDFSEGHKKEDKKVHFATLMDICHITNAELEPKYKGRVVIRGDTVKYDSGSYAVITAQGSSVPHRTAARVMDVIARLPDCAGQAADAVCAYMDTSSKTQRNHGQTLRIQQFFSNEICTDTRLLASCG